MVQADIPETPVSESIAIGNSITVPSGEIWKVRFMIGGDDTSPGNSYDGYVTINGNSVWYTANDGSSDSGEYKNHSENTFIVSDGDTVGFSSGGLTNATLHLSGVKVQNVVDNTPVKEFISDGNSLTVPAGEKWKVGISVGISASNPSSSFVVNVSINDSPAWTIGKSGGGSSGGFRSDGPEIILSAGDTISIVGNSSTPNLAITGFKV